MSSLRFQIRLHTGQVEQLAVEGDRALIGSAAHCEIRLPVDQARAEHVLIQVTAQGVFIRALSFEPPPTLNTMPFSQGPLAHGSVIGVGQCQIYVEFDAPQTADDIERERDAKKKKTSPMSWLAIPIIAAGAYFLLFDEPPQERAAPPPRTIPELWGPPVESCPYGGAQAAALAREKITLADSKRERRPFHIQDGVQAVPLYETASACFRIAGDTASAGLASESAKFLRRDITDEFRVRRLRLEHDLNIQDYRAAQKEVRTLAQFVEGKSGEYVTWLAELDRMLKRNIDVVKPASS